MLDRAKPFKSLRTGFKFWLFHFLVKWLCHLFNLSSQFPQMYKMKDTSALQECCEIKDGCGASLVAQWLGLRLPMQGTRVRALVWEKPTCRGAAGPVSHDCWACASGACAPQQERPRQWEVRAPRWGVAPARRNWRKPWHRGEDPAQPKINK